MVGMTRNEFFRSTRRRLLIDHDRRAHLHQIEKLDNVCISHADAAVAVSLANFVFVLRAVDVNETIAGVGVVRLDSLQPENARENEIVRPRKRIIRSERNATDEDRAVRHSLADLVTDAKFSERCFVAARFGAGTEARSRDWITPQNFPPAAQP